MLINIGSHCRISFGLVGFTGYTFTLSRTGIVPTAESGHQCDDDVCDHD